MTSDYWGEEVGMSRPIAALPICREIKTTDVTEGFWSIWHIIFLISICLSGLYRCCIKTTKIYHCKYDGTIRLYGKRSYGFTHICNRAKTLDGHKDELKPMFKSAPSQFRSSYMLWPTHKMSKNLSIRQLIDRELSTMKEKGIDSMLGTTKSLILALKINKQIINSFFYIKKQVSPILNA